METINPAVASDREPREADNHTGRPADQTDVRALRDHELWFVGGGDGIPGWGT